MKTKVGTLTVMMAAAAIVGCTGGKKSNYEALTAQTWELTAIVSDDSAATTDSIPEGVTVQFADSASFYGFGGCNRFFGTYKTTGEDQIKIEPTGRSMAYCPDIAFEDEFIALLGMCTTYLAEDSTLQLNDNSTRKTLVFKAVPNQNEQVE